MDSSTLEDELDGDTSDTETYSTDMSDETSQITETVSDLSVTGEESEDLKIFKKPSVPLPRKHTHHNQGRVSESSAASASHPSHGSEASDWHRHPRYQHYWRQQERAWHWYRQHVSCSMGSSPYTPRSPWPSACHPAMNNYYGAGMDSVSVEAWKRYHAACIEWLEQYEKWVEQRRHSHHSRNHGQVPPDWNPLIKQMKDRALGQNPESAPPRQRQGKRKSKRHHRQVKKRRQHRKHQVSETEGSLEVCVAGEGEEVVQMEITPEMLDFFAQSAKHREERDAKKQLAGSDEDHVELDEVPLATKKTTVKPPTEQPGVRRTTEMKQLYGAAAAMIHGMETAMQLNFDRNCDLKQPKLWPNLPLKIKFK